MKSSEEKKKNNKMNSKGISFLKVVMLMLIFSLSVNVCRTITSWKKFGLFMAYFDYFVRIICLWETGQEI